MDRKISVDIDDCMPPEVCNGRLYTLYKHGVNRNSFYMLHRKVADVL